MALFIDWMVFRDVATLLRLLESAEYFDPQDYNPVFEGELEKLIRRLPDSDARQQAAKMRGFDFGGYIARSLVRAGFRDDDQQEAFHGITNAMSESLNAKIQWVKYTARGFRNVDNSKNAIYFHCGGLDLLPRPTLNPEDRKFFSQRGKNGPPGVSSRTGADGGLVSA